MNIIYDVDKYINQVVTLDNQFYDDEYMWDDEYQKAIYEKNKDSFIACIYEDKLIGYLNYLTITDNMYNKIKTSNVIIDKFELDDIIPFSNDVNIFIDSVVIDKNYQDTDVVKYLTDGLLSKLKSIDSKYNIKSLSGTAISEDGKKLLTNLGMENVKLLNDGNNLFIREDNVIASMENSLNKLKNKKA